MILLFTLAAAAVVAAYLLGLITSGAELNQLRAEAARLRADLADARKPVKGSDAR